MQLRTRCGLTRGLMETSDDRKIAVGYFGNHSQHTKPGGSSRATERRGGRCNRLPCVGPDEAQDGVIGSKRE